MGYPELTPAMMTFLRGQPIPQTRVIFPEWKFTPPLINDIGTGTLPLGLVLASVIISESANSVRSKWFCLLRTPGASVRTAKSVGSLPNSIVK
jgi:hypothetical protein